MSAPARSTLSIPVGNSMWAVAYHPPTEIGGKPKGIARSLMPQQPDCLRIVLGAYRATPVRQLEVEAGVPPLDIYLSAKIAAKCRRLEDNGMAALLRGVSTTVAASCAAGGVSGAGPGPIEGPMKKPRHGCNGGLVIVPQVRV